MVRYWDSPQLLTGVKMFFKVRIMTLMTTPFSNVVVSTTNRDHHDGR